MISSEGMVPEGLPNNNPEVPAPQGIQPRPKMQALIKRQIIIKDSEDLRKNMIKRLKCQRWNLQDEKIDASNLKRLGVVVKASKVTTDLSLNIEGVESFGYKDFEVFSQNLQSLKNMKSITLLFRNRQIMKEEVETIRERLKRLSSLRTLNLYLRSSETTDQELYQMKKALSRLRSLQNLTFDLFWCYDISDRGLGYIFQGLKRLPLFRNLNFGADSYQEAPEGFSRMIQNLKGLVRLEKLRFDLGKWAKFGLREWKDFGQSLGCLTSLKTLKMRFFASKSLDNMAVANLSKALEKLVSLENLKFDATYCNNVNDEGVKSLANGLAGFTTLSSINIGFALESEDKDKEKNKNEITDISLQYLKEALKKQASLKKFTADFSWSGVTDEGLGSLIEGLERQNSPLQKMGMLLNECDITDTGLGLLCRKLNTFSSLKKLFFFFKDCKGMNGTHLKDLHECLKGLVDLQKVGFNFSWSSIPKNEIEQFVARLKRTFPLVNGEILTLFSRQYAPS